MFPPQSILVFCILSNNVWPNHVYKQDIFLHLMFLWILRCLLIVHDLAHFSINDSVFCLWLCETSKRWLCCPKYLHISCLSFLSGSENHKGLSFRLWVCPGPQNCVHLRGHGKTKAQNYLVQGWKRIVWPSLPTCKYIT